MNRRRPGFLDRQDVDVMRVKTISELCYPGRLEEWVCASGVPGHNCNIVQNKLSQGRVGPRGSSGGWALTSSGGQKKWSI